MYERELAFLEDIRLRRPESTQILQGSWNDAVSLKARLDKAIRDTHRDYAQIRPGNDLPFAGLTITVIKPSILSFTWGEVDYSSLL